RQRGRAVVPAHRRTAHSHPQHSILQSAGRSQPHRRQSRRPPVIGYLVQDFPLIHAFQPARRSRPDALTAYRIFKMAPKLSDYIQEDEILAVKGSLDRPISGLVIDSRRVVAGAVFFALPGNRTDGANFIDEAVSRGAVAVVSQNMPVLPPAKVTFIQVA